MSFITISFEFTFGQIVEIGQDADVVKSIVESSTRLRTGYDIYGNSKGNNVAWDVRYSDGHITDVIQCYTHQYIIEFRIHSNFCKHHMMENGKLAYVQTQYEDISTKNLKALYDQLYGDHKYGDYYFSEDYKHNSRIYLGSNNNATIEWRQTEPEKLPKELPKVIKDEIIRIFKDEQENQEIKNRKVVEPSYDDDFEKVFTSVQIEAEFPGGADSWAKYLQRCLNNSVPSENGAPKGKYTVNVSFIVDKNGNISDIKAENNPGFGTAEEAVRLIKKGPSWKPAVQNGHNVTFRKKQPITFVVQ